jgi:hypothetical protein
MSRSGKSRLITTIVAACLALGAFVWWTMYRDRYTPTLRAQIERADRIRVRSGGTCHRQLQEEQTLFEERDPGRVRQILSHISIDPTESGFHCMCCGNPSLEIYRGDELLATLGYHHGRSLRWVEGWKGDAWLTRASAAYLNAWLAEHGVESR